MPSSGPRAALLLLPPLLLLRAVLAVPLERGAPKQESPATESPVSGPALFSSQVFASGTTIPADSRRPWVDTSPTDAPRSWPASLCSPRGFDVLKNSGPGGNMCVHSSKSLALGCGESGQILSDKSALSPT